jgi:uncharacterized protein (DUF1330 family)
MAKGYWIARVTVKDPEAYKQYIAANAAAWTAYNGRFVVRAGRFECVEGTARERNVVIEFPSYEAARACYDSPEYAAAKAIRQNAAESDLIIIEGYDG